MIWQMQDTKEGKNGGNSERLTQGQQILNFLPLHSIFSSPTEEFYSLFYLGLFNEARGETAKAESYMKAAVRSTYAKAVGSRDYMVDCAKVHCQLRHWKA
jgi:hypothetical protein